MDSNTEGEPGTGGESDENALPLFANADFFVQPDSVTLGPLIGEGTFSSVSCWVVFYDSNSMWYKVGKIERDEWKALEMCSMMVFNIRET